VYGSFRLPAWLAVVLKVQVWRLQTADPLSAWEICGPALVPSEAMVTVPGPVAVQADVAAAGARPPNSTARAAKSKPKLLGAFFMGDFLGSRGSG
jgi:hypothetical protein